jgi:CBS domain-containing protein
MNARDLMTSEPTTCRATDNLKAIIGVMRREDCGIVPITEGNGEQRVVGVVTDRDVALALGERDEKPSAVRASEVMTTDIVSCDPDSDLKDLSRRMQEAQVRRILIVEKGRLLGVVSTADLARASTQSGHDRVGEEVEKVMEKVSEDTGSHRPRV